MGNKVSSIINIKQIQAYCQEESKSIKYQIISSFESISEKISRMLDPPPRSKLLLYELIQLVPSFGTMKFIHAC